MEVLDENGRVFGVINIIDLLVVLLVIAVVVAGVALVSGGGSSGSDEESGEAATVIVRAEEVQPYVANALTTGSVKGGNVTAIENVSVRPATVFTENESGAVLARDHPRLKTVELEVSVRVSDGPNGLVFQNRPLRIGRPVSIDAGTVVVRGNVVAIQSDTGE